MTKTLSLNISERLAALGILNSFKGNLDKLAIILEDIKQFPITDEEWAAAERTITPVPGTEDTQWKWSDEKGGEKEITVDEATADYVKGIIKDRSEKGELSLQDKAYITLAAKLV